MRTHYKLILLSFVTMMVMTVSGCRHEKETSDTISQQQVFPEREINVNASDTHKVEVADSIEPQDHVAQAVQAVEQAAHASHSSRSNSSRMTIPDPKTASDLEEEYYDVFGDEYLDHIDDYEYDQAENYDDHYQERWEHMPPQVVSNRPVTPRGQFRRFEPQQ